MNSKHKVKLKENIGNNNKTKQNPAIIKEVYEDNFLQEMAKLSTYLDKYRYIAMVFPS
jgi:hypothetical protein